MLTDQYINGAKQLFSQAIEHLKDEFSKLQIGTASAGLVEGMLIDVYGSAQPLKNIATISLPDPKSIRVQPWDKSNMSAIEKAIRDSDLGLNPNNAGDAIMLNIPPMTEERRKEVVKLVHQYAEEAKISVRNARHDAHAKFKELKNNDEITEDDVHGSEKKLQEHVDESNNEIMDLSKKKEEAVMTV